MASDTVAKTTEAEAEEAPPGEDMPLKTEVMMQETGAGDGSQMLVGGAGTSLLS